MSMEEALRDWVVKHKVCWEMAPLVERNGETNVQVGYELQLFARHEAGAHPEPGCAKCEDMYRNLRAIALFALPHEERPSRYDIAPFHASFCLRPESEWIPEVQLTIQIIHRAGYFRPIDDCEKKCAGEIQKCLRALGAQPKSWSAFRTAS